GLKYIFSITSTFYPRILSLGYYSPSVDTIVVAKVFNWRLRLEHERGHSRGLKHTWKLFHVMHPLGLFRGGKY
ncbi:MAG: hypothetical protein KAJ03_02950, partial [Gammaproteobacteria bacterium]|nr:hypothetical protein [Gammaproteobacteria bacterium]